MTLSERQFEFTHMVALLILHAEQLGYKLTFGDTFRDNRCDYGSKDSNHRRRLAVDFNLFLNGAYLTKTESHTVLGNYWESLHPNNRWGGRFSNKDGNHYEMEV